MDISFYGAPLMFSYFLLQGKVLSFARVGPGGGGEHFLIRGYWGCAAAGWGRIFTTGLTIMG